MINSVILHEPLRYIILSLYIQMEQRAPNQYKPTFLEKVLSVILPVPTRRVLSDKKIDKKKKINLSLTSDKKNKSTKMLTVSSSFLSKVSPTGQKNNYFQSTHPQSFNTSTLKRDQEINHRDLYFHPRKINFHNQSIHRQKIKTRLVNATADLMGKEQSRQMLVLHPKKQKQPANTFHSLREKRIPAFFKNLEIKNEQRYSNRKQENPQFNKKNVTLSLDHSDFIYERQQEENKIQKIIVKQKDKRILSYNSSQLYQHQAKLAKQKQQKLSKINQIIFYQPPTAKYTQNHCQKSAEFKKIPENTQKLVQKGSPLNKIIIRQSDLHVNLSDQQVDPNCQTPKINKSIFDKVMLEETNQQKQDKFKTKEQQQKINENLQIKNPICTLFADVRTISSKGDQSSQKSESQCYSNVVFRMNGDDFKQKRMDNEPRSWEQPRRHTLKTNLLQKFQEEEDLNKTQNLGRMNFKKKKSSLQQRMTVNQEAELYTNQQMNNLKYLEEQFITKQYKYECTQPQTEQKQPKNKSIYEQFNKINYIGVGRFASVYLCSLPHLNFVFAMKQILKFTVKCNSIQNQLKNQILIQYSCSHPNIINLYNAWADEKKYYLALEYGQETLLSKIQKNNFLSEEQCVKSIYEIGKGLNYLHDRAIVHRDIKPENIIIINGVCKIGDFGWCASIQSGILSDACGTPCYISPQMQECTLYTTKTDCWSLGMLAYQIINGKLDQQYFGRDTIIESDKLPYRNGVSSQYKGIVQKLLQKQQQNRITIKQFLTLPIFSNLV